MNRHQENELHYKMVRAWKKPRLIKESQETILGKDSELYKSTLNSLSEFAPNIQINNLTKEDDNIKLSCTFDNITLVYDHKNGVFLTGSSIKMNEELAKSLYKVVAYLNGIFKKTAAGYINS